ncbi:hypothetical protein MMC14_008168 [Varicellaria rhodocarpa]|nr:hypothetical protein [Varicellaria rhodocarpa]
MSVLVHAGRRDLEESSEKHGSNSPGTSDSIPWHSSNSVVEERTNYPVTLYEPQEKVKYFPSSTSTPTTPPSSYLAFLEQLPNSQSPTPSPAAGASNRSVRRSLVNEPRVPTQSYSLPYRPGVTQHLTDEFDPWTPYSAGQTPANYPHPGPSQWSATYEGIQYQSDREENQAIPNAILDDQHMDPIPYIDDSITVNWSDSQPVLSTHQETTPAEMHSVTENSPEYQVSLGNYDQFGEHLDIRPDDIRITDAKPIIALASFLVRPFRPFGLKLSILERTFQESSAEGIAQEAFKRTIGPQFYFMACYPMLLLVSITLNVIPELILFIILGLRYYGYLGFLDDKEYRRLLAISAWVILENDGKEGGDVEGLLTKRPTGFSTEFTKLLIHYNHVVLWALRFTILLMVVDPIPTKVLQYLAGREPPLKEGKVRIRHRCRCGKQIFGDYQELRPGAAAKWQERLNKQLGAAEGSGRRGKISDTLKILFDRLTFQTRENKKSSDTPDLPLTNISSTPDPNQRPNSQAPTSLKFLLLCIKHEKWAIKLKHANACSITSDVQLFRILASEYRAARCRSLLSMRKLGSIKFLRFEALQKAEIIGVRKVPDYPPECNPDYDYKPRPLDLLPPISENEMMHYFHCPDHALDIPLFLERMPLKLNGRLDLSSGANTGWGIIFNDCISWKKVWMMAFIGMLSSAVAGLIWWFIRDDAQGGSVIAGVTAPIVLVTMGAIQGYLGEID